MTKNATKRALLSSALALVVCISMLIGTTYAWFTDSVTSANNIIKSGNLDIELEYWTGTAWKSVDGASDVITNTNFEPGVTEIAYLRLANEGSLALKYQLGINVVSEKAGINAAGESFKLSDYVMFGVVENVNAGAFATREDAVAAITSAKEISAGYTKAASMTSGQELYFALVVYMPTNVGNVANHNGTNVPEINLGLNVFATQKMAEEDSFGNNYDDGAFIPVDPTEKPDNGALVLNSSAESNVTVTVPADVLSDLGNEVTALSIAASAPVLDNTNSTVTFSTLELVDQNGKEVDISNSTTKVTVTLPVGDVFENGETVVIFHDGEYMATAIVNNGFISYQAEHFCEVVVSTIEAPVEEDGIVKIGNAADLFGLAQNVNSGTNYYAGKTVVLTADIDLKDAEWTPIGSAAKEHGFMGNFDGNGKTISNLSINNIKPDADGYAYAGLFGVTEGIDKDNQNSIKNLVIKNVTINTTGHIVSAAIAYPYYTALENITVCGDIAITGGDYTAGALAYTRRCVDAKNITVNGNTGSYITGGITVGGVISDIQMNGGLKANYSNFSASNITVSGVKCVGGISGIIGGQTLNGANVNNVTLVCSDIRVGIVSGAFDTKPAINNPKYSNVTGTTSLVGAPYDAADSNGFVIINGVECAGNVAAFKEQLATGTVNLAANIALNETITIAKGNNVVINLNGNTISGTLSGTGNQDLFLVKGTLTLNNGNVELTATQNQGWNAMSTIFDITDGGVVNLESVVADNKGGTDMNFVAHLNNWGTATLNVNNSTLKATYVAVRVFNSGHDMNNVSITNSTLSTTGNAAFWVHNYTVADFGTQEKADAQAKLLNFNFENNTYVAKKAAFRLGMTNAEYYTADNSAVVSTADELIAALEAGLDVVFANDIKIEPANMSNAYGKTGINVKNGQTIDGNGYTLNIKGAGGTWDSGINTTGGVIKNITVTGSFRGIFINHTSSYSEKVVLDNVTLTGVTYTISCDQGLNQGLVATNCTFNGWTSFAKTLGEAEFIDCAFGEGNGYAYCRPYAPTTFNNCTFSEGYAVDTTRTTVNFVDCEC